MVRSKGVTAFAIYFIVLSATIFINQLSTLVSYVLDLIKAPSEGGSLLSSYFSSSPVSIFTLIVAAVGVIGAILLLRAALNVMATRENAISSLRLSAFVLILYELLAIGDVVRGVMTGTGAGYFDSYSIPLSLAYVIFWLFVLKFFSDREDQFPSY